MITRAYADSRWGQLHYRMVRPQNPSRPPLLCLHQTPKSGWEFEPVMPLLGADRAVFAVDTPGYGQSAGPDTPASIEDFADVMAAFMDTEDGPFDVMGVHTGSVVAAQLARAYPARVRRVVLIGLAAYDAETRAQKLEKLKAYPKPKDDLSHIQAIWGVMQTLFDPQAPVAWRHRSLAENLISGERMSWGYDAVYRYDFIKALSEVAQTTLVINPEDDLWAVTPVAAALLRSGRRVDLPNLRHGLFAIQPERMAGLIGDFLDAP